MSSSETTTLDQQPQKGIGLDKQGIAPLSIGSVNIGQPRLFVLVLLILLLAAALRLYDLGAESFSYDEGIMIEATSSGWETVMANITRGRPPLIVLIGFGWIQLWGESEFMVRLLPALMGIISVYLLIKIGQMLYNDYVGLVAGFIIAISSFHLFHSQDYRYYSLLTLMTVLSFYFFIRCFGLNDIWFGRAVKPSSTVKPGSDAAADSFSPDRSSSRAENRWLPKFFLYILFSTLIYYTHYQGVFALVAQGLFFLTLWFQATNRLRLRWFLSQVAIGLLLVPSIAQVLLDFVAGSGDGDYQGTIGALGNLGPLSDPELWLPFHTILIKFHFISISNLLQWPTLLASGLLLIAGFISVRRTPPPANPTGKVSIPSRQSDNQDRTARGITQTSKLILLVFWMVCPVFIPFILSKLLSPMYLPRYTITALPAVCLLMALILVRWRYLVPLWATLGAFVILTLPGLSTYYAKDFKDQWRIAAVYVEEQIVAASSPEEGEAAVDNKPLLAGQEAIAKTPLVFVSVNNETADRIQKLFKRYYATDIATNRTTKSGAPATKTDAQSAPLLSEGRALSIEANCAISAGLTAPDKLSEQFQSCFLSAWASNANGIGTNINAEPESVWMITRTAKEGPQLEIEERALTAILDALPPGWQQVEETRFSGVVVRLYSVP